MLNIALVSSSDEAKLESVLRNNDTNIVYKFTVVQLLAAVNEDLKLDVIVFTRLDNSTTNSQNLITYLNRRKIPIIVGYINYSSSGIGANSSNMLGMLGLSNSVSDPNGLNSCYVYSNNPLLTTNTSLVAGNTFNAYTGGEYMTTTSNSSILQSAEILTNNNSTTVTSAYFKKGIITFSNTTLEMDVIFLGFLSSRATLTTVATTIVKNVLEFLSIKKYKIGGSVTTLTKEPLQRNIFVLDQATMELITSSRSEENGLYTIHLRDNNPVTVICTPENTDKNALISYNITPVLREDLE